MQPFHTKPKHVFTASLINDVDLCHRLEFRLLRPII